MDRKLISFLVIAMMLLTIAPVISTDGLSTSSDDQYRTGIEQNPDGSYTVRADYLESVFGINDSGPSSVSDPVGYDAIGINPLELGFWMGGEEGYYYGTDPETGKVTTDHAIAGNTDSNHSVGFSAALTRNNQGQYPNPQNDPYWKTTGSEKFDWFCALYYDNATGELMLDAACPGGHSSISVDKVAGTSPFPLEQIDKVSSLQSENILNFAVGDFDGDGNEEIAVHHWFGIYVLGLDQTTLKFVLKQTFDVPRYDGYGNSLFTPVSMAAGDVDYDGTQDIIVTRGYIKGGQAGNMEFTDLGVLNCVTDKSKWVRVSITDPKNNASTLDSIMTSVTSGDIDNDGKPEIIVGGYLWDNTNTSGSYTKDWGRSAGELYLSVIQPEELMSGKTVFRYVTVMGDDNGLASTRYIDNSDFNGGKYSLNNHNLTDTSIYLTDKNDNPSGLCRSVNWCNWTIPLQAGSLSGYVNGNTCDQVYFDKWFYSLSDGSFHVYLKTPQLSKTMDDNNVICAGIGVGQITTRNASDFNGTEEFMVFYGADLEKHFDRGWTEWVFSIYGSSDSSTARTTYSVDLPNKYRDLRDWGLYNVGRVFCGNFNADAFYLEMMGHMFTYTDPTVIAMIAPVPYDADLAAVLNGGADVIGETDFTRYTATEEETETSVSFDIGPAGGVDFIVKADFSLKYTHDVGWSQSKTITLSTSYASSDGAVAMYVMPTDIYMYRVYEPLSDGTYNITCQMLPFYGEPVETMLDYDEYVDFIETYNSIMKDSIPDYVDLPVMDITEHVSGDITSYTYRPAEPLSIVDVHYKASGSSGTITKDVDLEESSSLSEANGFLVNISVQAKILAASMGGEFSFSYTDTVTKTDVSGMAFSSTLAQGMEYKYLGERSEAHSVLSQYSMSGTFWAEMRTANIDGKPQDYVYVGYTVDKYTTSPAMGTLIPDVYIPGGDDEDDPYNPTYDSVCIMVTLPGTVDRPDRAANDYVLQVNWQGRWYDVDGSVLGFSVYEETDGYWSGSNGHFAPGAYESSFWIMVDGLSGVSNTDFRFRIDAVRQIIGSELHNPSLAVTAYKDTRIMDVGCSMMIGQTMTKDYGLFDDNGVRVVLIDDKSVYEMDGRMLVFVKTDLEPGERVELWHYNENSGFTMLNGDLHVYYDGYVIYDIENVSVDPEPYITFGAIVLLALGLVFLIGFNIRKH